jgi:hypothetical protein
MTDDGTEPGEDRVPEVYEQREKASPEERTEIVLRLIEKERQHVHGAKKLAKDPFTLFGIPSEVDAFRDLVVGNQMDD